jgi:BUD22
MNKELEGSLVVLAEPGTTVAKIQSRLLSSKFLSIQVATSLEVLKVLLNPALKQNESEINTHAPSGKDKERPTKLRKETSMATLHSTAKAPPRLDLTIQDANMDMEGWESGSIDEGGVEEPDDSDIGPNDTLTDEEDAFNWESESESNKKTESRPSKPGKADKSLSSKNESTFLPSLSVGFVRGGSDDSDWSETEGKDTDLEPRKNRRGQRARRA